MTPIDATESARLGHRTMPDSPRRLSRHVFGRLTPEALRSAHASAWRTVQAFAYPGQSDNPMMLRLILQEVL